MDTAGHEWLGNKKYNTMEMSIKYNLIYNQMIFLFRQWKKKSFYAFSFI